MSHFSMLYLLLCGQVRELTHHPCWVSPSGSCLPVSLSPVSILESTHHGSYSPAEPLMLWSLTAMSREEEDGVAEVGVWL